MLTKEQQAEIIAGAMDQMKESLIETATNSATWTIKDAVKANTRAEVDKFFKEEIAPDIRAALIANKDAIVKAAVVAADDMAATLAQSMSEELANRLGKTWERSKILKAMFE